METEIEQPMERRKESALLTGSFTQGTLGAIAIALAIYGLVRMRIVIGSIAIIILGLAFLLEGGILISRFASLLNETGKGMRKTFEISEGVSAEFLGGTAGIVLGILSLFNIVPSILFSVAAIVYGAALMLGAAVNARLDNLIIYRNREDELSRKVGRTIVSSSAGIQILIGLSGVILGIVAIYSFRPMMINFAAMLVLAFGTFLTGAGWSSRMLSVFVRK